MKFKYRLITDEFSYNLVESLIPFHIGENIIFDDQDWIITKIEHSSNKNEFFIALVYLKNE